MQTNCDGAAAHVRRRALQNIIHYFITIIIV